MKRVVRNSLTVDIAETQNQNKERANTSQMNKSQMVQKRDVISEAAELVKDKVFSRKSTTGQVKLEEFEFKKHIRKAGPGKIYLAKLPSTGCYYDIMSMRKDRLIQRGYINSIKRQKDILFCADHPFLAGMEYLFQQETRLYFVMPHIQGTVLSEILRENNGRLSEDVIQFYAAQIILAVGDLHSKGVMHRNLTAENIIVEEDGFIKIIDFGYAKMM